MWRLSLDFAFEGIAHGMTPEQHRAQYGFDLSWIQQRAGRLECSVCRERLQFGSEDSLELKQVMCSAFVENHARCVRIEAEPGRAA